MIKNIYDEIGQASIKYYTQINKLLEPLKLYLGVDRMWRNSHKVGGLYSLIGNYPATAEIFFEEKLYIGHPCFRSPIFFQSGYSIPSLLHSQEFEETQGRLTQDGDCFHILLAIVKKGEDFVEYGFATSKFSQGFEQRFLNNLHIISKFIDYFENNASKYILEAEDRSINIASIIGSKYFENPKLTGPTMTPQHEFIFLSSLESDKDRAKALFLLTKSEREALRYLLQGYSMPEIAKKRFRSLRTIETHLENAKAKLGISSRSALFDFLLPYRDLL